MSSEDQIIPVPTPEVEETEAAPVEEPVEEAEEPVKTPIVKTPVATPPTTPRPASRMQIAGMRAADPYQFSLHCCEELYAGKGPGHT